MGKIHLPGQQWAVKEEEQYNHHGESTMQDGSATSLAAIEQLRQRLQLAGWRLGETGQGSLWQVNGRKGCNRLVVTGQTQVQAWWNACVAAGEGEQAPPVR
jgi:hypothetical protein